MNINTNDILSVIKDYFGIEIESIKYIGGGSFGRVYKCVDKTSKPYAFKIFLAPDMVEKEALSLKMLAAGKAIKIPEVYFTLTKNENIPFDCMLFEFIEGKSALMNAKLLFASKKKRDKFADSVVDALLEIHKIKSDKFGPIENPTYDKWLDFYKPFAQNIYDNAIEKSNEGAFDKSILEVMHRAWAKFDYIFSEEVTEACIIHGDLNVMNIMIDDDLKPVAFIDPLNSMYADREYDLFQFQNLTGNCFKLYENYKSKFCVSDKCDLKCAFYRLWNEVMVTLNTGSCTNFIMRACVKNMKKQLRTLE